MKIVKLRDRSELPELDVAGQYMWKLYKEDEYGNAVYMPLTVEEDERERLEALLYTREGYRNNVYTEPIWIISEALQNVLDTLWVDDDVYFTDGVSNLPDIEKTVVKELTDSEGRVICKDGIPVYVTEETFIGRPEENVDWTREDRGGVMVYTRRIDFPEETLTYENALILSVDVEDPYYTEKLNSVANLIRINEAVADMGELTREDF